MTYSPPPEGTARAASIERARAENARRLRQTLIDAGIIVPDVHSLLRIDHGPVLRLDARGRQSAQRHMREGTLRDMPSILAQLVPDRRRRRRFSLARTV